MQGWKIGSVPTPWASWMISASTSSSRAPADQVRGFLASLSEYVRAFSQGLQKTKPVGVDILQKPIREDRGEAKDEAEETNVNYIVQSFGYPEKDVREWMDTVGYPGDVGMVDLSVIGQTLKYVIQLSTTSSNIEFAAACWKWQGLLRGQMMVSNWRPLSMARSPGSNEVRLVTSWVE